MGENQQSNTDVTGSVPDDVFAEVQDHGPESLRDLQYLYGQLYVSYQRQAFGADDEYAVYLTPEEASEALGTADSLVSVDIDVSGGTTSYEGVRVTAYDPELVDVVAHAKYDASRGIDHSITHETGGDTPVSTVTGYAVDRVSEWPSKQAVDRVGQTHSNGWVIDALQVLGDDEDAMESVREDVEQALSGKKRRLVTVRLRGVDGGSEWQYPGEIPVLMDSMVELQRARLADKSDADDARDEGVGYITGEEGEVYGVAPDPLNWYLTMQRESFDTLDAEESWRTQPITADAALYANKSEQFLEACQYTTAGASVYVLPYFSGKQSREKIEALNRVLVGQLRQVKKMEQADSDDGMRRPTHLERLYAELPEEYLAELKMHVLAMHKYHPSKYRSVYTQFGADVLTPVTVAEAHHDVLRTVKETEWLPWVISPGGALDPERGVKSLTPLIASPWYFGQSMPESDDDDPGVDEPYFIANQKLVSGEPIAIEFLLDAFTDQISDRWDPGDDGTNGVPAWAVSLQYTQLAALSEAELLTSNTSAGESVVEYVDPDVFGDDTRVSMVNNTNNSNNGGDDDGDGVSSAERRKANYESFFDSHGLLRDNPERRAAFAFGALVGEVSRYQKQQNTNPLAKNMTADAITKRNLTQRVTDVIDRVQVYSETSDIDMAGTMYRTLTTTITDDMHHTPPEEWDLSVNDLRFHYALGVTYGLNNTSSTKKRDGTDEESKTGTDTDVDGSDETPPVDE